MTWTTILIFYTWPLNDIPVVHDKENYACFDPLVRYLRQTCFSWQNDIINTVPNLHPFYSAYWMCACTMQVTYFIAYSACATSHEMKSTLRFDRKQRIKTTAAWSFSTCNNTFADEVVVTKGQLYGIQQMKWNVIHKLII